MSDQLNVSTDEMNKVFTTWFARFLENPDDFQVEGEMTPEKYGEFATNKFIELLSELKGVTEDE